LEDLQTIFSSVKPQIVIFEGFGYMNAEWSMEQKDYFSLLAGVLEESKNQKVDMLIFLSSTEVYGDTAEYLQADIELVPKTRRGMWLAQAENMVQAYHKQHRLTTAILRLSQVFGDEIDLNAKDYFAELAKLATEDMTIIEEILQPIHVDDVADAVKRIIDRRESVIYNVCSSFQIKKSKVLQFIGDLYGKRNSCTIESEERQRVISNQRLKEEQEWVDFWKLEEQFQTDKIKIRKKEKEKAVKTKKRKELRGPVRKLLENLVIFAFFFILYLFTRDHSLFSQVSWMLIYVMLISLVYGVKQSAMAVVLASIGHLLVQRGSLVNMTNFYTYIENVLVIVEYVFFGIIIGYTVDMLREQLRIKGQETEELQQAFDRLKDINEQNVMTKCEYEKRILDSKTSIPKLYSIIQKIDVLDTERIFMEVLHVIEELMDTDTVAVYKVGERSNYLRLIAALNDKSIMEKRSWNLEKYPKIKEGICKNELYEGDIWNNEPAIVMPISINNVCKAVIVIKEVDKEKMSLYHINLLRTLLLLVSRSLESAFQYDEAMRAQKYYGNTDILIPQEFVKAVELAKEKKQREIADYAILRLKITGDLVKTFERIDDFFRDTDMFGMDKQGNMFVLLGNASKEDEASIRERLAKHGVEAYPIKDFDLGE